MSRERLKVIQNEPLYCGQDFGHNPSMVIGQSWQGQIRVIAALTIERGGARQLLEQAVIPWLRMNAPWVFKESNMIHGQYDPAAPDSQDDIEQNPVLTLEKLLPGSWWYPAPSKWEERKGPLVTALQRNIIFDPIGCKSLIQALSGRWHYQQDRMGNVSHDLPKKNHPWSDLGDALCYMLTALMPEMERRLVHHEPTTVLLHRPEGILSGWRTR